MSTITQVISALHDIPTTADQANFDANADDLLGDQLPNLVSQINTWRGQANTVAGEVNTNAEAVATNTPIAVAAAATATSAPGTSGTSTTSLTLALGQLSFTTATGKTWAAGMRGKLARTSDAAVQAQGYVVSYNSGTGAVVFQCEQTTGGGPYTDWTFSHEGAKGNDADLVMPSWAPGADAAVAVSRNGNICRPSATLTLTPDSAAALGDGFSLLIAPTAGTTTVGSLGAVRSGTAALLVSNGTATALVMLSTGPQVVSVTTAAAASVVDFTGLEAGYDYRVRFNSVRGSTANANLLMRVSNDNGATFLAGASDYAFDGVGPNSSSPAVQGNSSAGTSAISLTTTYAAVQTTAPDGIDGMCFLFNPARTGDYAHAIFDVAARVSGGAPRDFFSIRGTGFCIANTSAVNAIRILLSAGNVSGTFILERLPRS